MSWLPDNMDDTRGAIYVVTHPREFDREQWTEATTSCLTGEHGPEAREMVYQIARRLQIALPPETE